MVKQAFFTGYRIKPKRYLRHVLIKIIEFEKTSDIVTYPNDIMAGEFEKMEKAKPQKGVYPDRYLVEFSDGHREYALPKELKFKNHSDLLFTIIVFMVLVVFSIFTWALNLLFDVF